VFLLTKEVAILLYCYYPQIIGAVDKGGVYGLPGHFPRMWSNFCLPDPSKCFLHQAACLQWCITTPM